MTTTKTKPAATVYVAHDRKPWKLGPAWLWLNGPLLIVSGIEAIPFNTPGWVMVTWMFLTFFVVLLGGIVRISEAVRGGATVKEAGGGTT